LDQLVERKVSGPGRVTGLQHRDNQGPTLPDDMDSSGTSRVTATPEPALDDSLGP
jgi:hypothetical protein